MGLFDFLNTGNKEKDEALARGLLSTGLSLMQAKGRFFPAIGQAGMQGVQAFDAQRQAQEQAKARAMQMQMQQMQLAEMKRNQEIAALPQQFYRSQPAMGATLEEAPTPAVNEFDMAGYIQALKGKAPMQAMQLEAALQKQAPKLETVAEGAQAGYIDPKTGRWVQVAVNPKAIDPIKPTTLMQNYEKAVAQGFKGTIFDYEKALKTAGATRVDTRVNTERSYFGNVAEGLAKQDVAAIEAARSGPERIRSARQVKQILSTQTPITGTFAEQRLAVSKALATAGVISEDSAAATESLASGLASQALAAIKTSGLGAGSGFSNADRDFLERAAAGKIDMTQGALLRIADLNEKAAVRAITYGNKVIGRLGADKTMGSVGAGLEPIDLPTESRMPSLAEIAAEARRRGLK